MYRLNVQVPLLFKIMASSTAWFFAGSIIIGCTSPSSSSYLHTRNVDGAARMGSTLFSEAPLRSIRVFAKVGQATIRRVASNTLLGKVRTSIFIAHRLRTVVEAGEYPCLSPEAPCLSVGIFFLEFTSTSSFDRSPTGIVSLY